MRALLLSVLLAFAASVSAQPAPLDSLARAFAAEHDLPSLVLAVSVGGERWVASAGSLDSLGTPPDARTLYEIGSITKVVTALALADAVGRGEVALDTPVRDLLPEGAMAEQHESGPVRLWHLSTHTSGLPRIPLEMGFVPGFDMADPYALYDVDALYQTLSTPRAETAPGETVAYSNLAVGLLGHALAHQAGTTYADLVTTRVLGPLGMTDTFVEVPVEAQDRLATPHDGAGAPTAPWTMTDAIAGAGVLRSTAADLLTLGEAALDPPVALADAFALTLEPRVDAGNRQRVGLGWFLQPAGGVENRTAAFHSGGTGGFRSTLFVVPDAGLVVVALTNRSVEAGVDRLVVQTARAVLAGD